MRTEKLKGVQKLDLELANNQWSTARWQKWCIQNQVGVIIEDGKVSGWEVREQRYHK